MRFAIFGDIHANLEALNAVLADAQAHGVTHYVCLGDIVGYAANPGECLEIVRALECPVVQGNHDEQACANDDLAGFNPLAQFAIDWTRQQLSPEQKDWLRAMKLVRQVRDFTIVHATLDTPQRWGYIFNPLDAEASFNYQNTQLCFYGHTHAPRAYVRDSSTTVHSHAFTADSPLPVEAGKKYFVNVGSVGQPRDGDWHASYCLYTPADQSIQLRRLEYEIGAAQDKILSAGLPQRLADRLALGK
jgi:predicted phosphodiesterase